jgi:RNA polymerase sigma-70 factor, ECF subfamily
VDTEEKVRLAQKGDDNAFYELMSQRKNQLYKTAFTYVKSREDALDIVSDTVYKAYISVGSLKNPEFFNTWLTRILINTSIDFIKKNSKVVTYEETSASDNKKAGHSEEEIIDLKLSIDKLDLKYKTIVILKCFQDMILMEISEVLQCPLGTVKTNLHKALEQLRVDLKEELL